MKLWTARSLVRAYLQETHLSQRRVDDAVTRARADGWRLAYHPKSDEPSRTIPAVRDADPYCDLYQETYAASRVERHRDALVQRGTVQAMTGMSCLHAACGRRLGQRGLMLFHADSTTAHLIGTNPELATLVNGLRYGAGGQPRGRGRGVESALVVQAVLGLESKPRRRVSDDRLYTVAERLHHLGICAQCLFDREPICRPTSSWTMDQQITEPLTDLSPTSGAGEAA